MSNIEFRIGEYYHVEYNKDKFAIIRCDRIIHNDDTRITSLYISNMNGGWHFKTDNVYVGPGRICRIATWQEKAWLKECIKKNKFIKQDDIKFIGESYSIWF